MKLNIKRFAPELDEYNPEYSYTYTKKGYVATVEVSIECDYDISSIELSRGETLLGDLVDVTSDWTFYNDGSSIKRTFTESCHDTFVINFENATVTGYVIVNTSDDFTPESEQYPVEINGDIRISNSKIKLKKVAETIKDLTDIIYPVGSIYKSTNAINPQNIFGGTWTQITDDTVVAYGHAAGTTLSQSKNISSITNLGSSTYQVAFSKTMANADYKAFVSGECSGLGSEIIGIYNQTTSGFRYDFANYSGTATIPTSINIVVIGKLANPEYYEWKRTA